MDSDASTANSSRFDWDWVSFAIGALIIAFAWWLGAQDGFEAIFGEPPAAHECGSSDE